MQKQNVLFLTTCGALHNLGLRRAVRRRRNKPVGRLLKLILAPRPKALPRFFVGDDFYAVRSFKNWLDLKIIKPST